MADIRITDPRLIMANCEQPIPRLIPWQKDGSLERVIGVIGAARRRVLLRVTGGCAEMSDKDAEGCMGLFDYGLRGYDGAMLIGGSRMIFGKDRRDILFGITEVGPMVRIHNPDCVVVGVVPRFKQLDLDEANNIWIIQQQLTAEEKSDRRFTTIIHPAQDWVIAANSKTPLTKGRIWDDEVEFCRMVMELKHELSHWAVPTVCYNGGGTSEMEMRANAGYGWPILIVGGSGRQCNVMASDKRLTGLPNVEVCDNEPTSFREALEEMEIVEPGIARGGLRLAR